MSAVEILAIQMLIFWARHSILAGIVGLVSLTGRALGISHRIQAQQASKEIVFREILWSVSAGVILVLAMDLVLEAAERGYTRVYFDVSSRGLPWFFTSIGCALILHDAYFYWTHRLMHDWKALRQFHGLHHRFTNPTSWSAFSFHPVETLIATGILPLVAWTIPIHPLAFFCFTTLMTAQSVMLHCGSELTPSARRGFASGIWMRSRSHNDHHRGARGNYGLYLTLWDIAMGTLVTRSLESTAPGQKLALEPGVTSDAPTDHQREVARL